MLATPPQRFATACLVMAALVRVVGCLLAIAGGFSGALPAKRINEMLDRVAALQTAVKFPPHHERRKFNGKPDFVMNESDP